MSQQKEISSELGEIGNILASLSDMSDIRDAVSEIGGQIIASEDDFVFVSCRDAAEASRRVKGALANVVVGKLNNKTIFLRRGRA